MKKANLKKLIPIVTAVVTSLTATISIIYMAGRAIIELPDGGGGTYEELVAYPLYDEKGFLDSELFSDIAMKDAEKIVRFCVIRNQFETNGVYNGRKKIDINAFAERDMEIKSDLPKVEYYLDDLLKWGNYGFTIQTVTGTPNEVNTYFNSLKGKNDSTVTNVTGEASVGQSQEASGLESEEIYYDPSWSVYPDYPIDEEAADHMNVLVSRYNTADGKSLID